MKIHDKPTVLLAGATGYLGQYISKQLHIQGFNSKLLARQPKRIQHLKRPSNTILQAEVTNPKDLVGLMEGIHTVISTIGITKQKDGLTYWQVDYQANLNVLEAAIAAGVKKFIYISAIDGQNHRHLKIFEAKEAFVKALKNTHIQYCIIRPNGFFSDMKAFLEMAQKGRLYLFGNGEQKINPIHGEDLAKICIEAITQSTPEISVGGPDIFTHNEIAKLAFQSWKRPVNIKYLPHWFRKFILRIMPYFLSSKTYGPIEFFLTFMAEDHIAPRYGQHRLKDFYNSNTLYK